MLQIGIGNSSSLVPHEDKSSLFLEDDGYYWFLCPLLQQLGEQTGQWIDPYEYACFEGVNLAFLAQTLKKAKTLIENQPEVWSVSLGIQHHGGNQQEIFQKLSKAYFQELLNRWQALCTRAEKSNLGVVCYGD